MRVVTLIGGLVGSGVLLAGLSAAVSSAALGVLLAVIGLLSVRLVASAPWWLQAVVGIGAALLATSVWLTAESEVGATRLNVVVGVVGVVGFGAALVVALRRGRRSTTRRSGDRGPGPSGEIRGRTSGEQVPRPAVSREHGVRVPAPRSAAHDPGRRRHGHRAQRGGRRARRRTRAR